MPHNKILYKQWKPECRKANLKYINGYSLLAKSNIRTVCDVLKFQQDGTLMCCWESRKHHCWEGILEHPLRQMPTQHSHTKKLMDERMTFGRTFTLAQHLYSYIFSWKCQSSLVSIEARLHHPGLHKWKSLPCVMTTCGIVLSHRDLE